MDQESIIQASSLVLKDEGKSDTKGIFHAKMDSIKDRNGMDLTEAENIRSGKNAQKNCTKEIFTTKIIMMV